MNFNAINRFVLSDFCYTLMFYFVILALVFVVPNYPNLLSYRQLESPISPETRSSTVYCGVSVWSRTTGTYGTSGDPWRYSSDET
jgi:hypothetical protein